MSLKAIIITKLKEKAKALGINLSNVRINGLADKLDTLVENEDDIDGEVDKLNTILPFKELAALDDAKRNADKLAAEEEDGKKPSDPAKVVDPNNPDPSDKDKDKDKGEMPAWFKSHVESQNKVIEGLTSKLTAFEKGTVSQTRRQQLETKLKDAPDKFKTRTLRDFDRLKIESEDEFTSYLADIEQDVADEVQNLSDAGLGGDNPVGGLGGRKLKEEEVSSEMKELIADRKAAIDATAKTA